MRNFVVILFLIFVTQTGFGQNDDSTIVKRVSDNYIEIQTLRHTLYKWSNTENGAKQENFVPRPITIKNGIVFIKDRINTPIALYVYSDSIIIQHDSFLNGYLSKQSIIFSDSTSIDSYYWKNGNLQSLSYTMKNQSKIYNYSKEGDLIDIEENYTELIRKADNYLFNKNYSKALEFYKKAEKSKPSEIYPKDRIAQVKDLLKNKTDSE